MHSGLDKILEKISEDPSNKVLTDRYVALVRELEADRDKVVYMLKLAHSLKEPDPRNAMEFALMVFQYDQANVEALELISGCLRIMGRYGKSEVIKNEIAKIRKLQEEKKIDFDLAEKFVTEVSSIRVEQVPRHEFIEPMDELPDDAFIPDISADPKITVPMDVLKPKPMPRSVLADPNRPQQEQVLLDLQLPGQAVVAPRATKGAPYRPVGSSLDDVAPIGTIINNQENMRAMLRPKAQATPQAVTPPVVPHSPVARTAAPKSEPHHQSQSEPPEPLENASLPERKEAEPEQMPSSWLGPELSVLIEQFDFYYKQGMMPEARQLLRDTESQAKHLTWWKARRAILDASPIPVLAKPEEPTLSGKKRPEVPQNLLTGLDQWTAEVLYLIESGKARKALNKIRHDLVGHTDMSPDWGQAVMPLLDMIWRELDLIGFHWEPHEGMAKLLELLQRRQPIRLSALSGKIKKKKPA